MNCQNPNAGLYPASQQQQLFYQQQQLGRRRQGPLGLVADDIGILGGAPWFSWSSLVIQMGEFATRGIEIDSAVVGGWVEAIWKEG